MTPTRLLLFCVLLMGVGGGLWWLASTQGEAPNLIELPEATEDALLQGDPSLLRRITLEEPRYGRTIVLGLEEGTWRILEPIIDWPEPFALSGALQVLFGNDWTEEPAEWRGQSEADLGLDSPALLVEAIYEDGTSEYLTVGAEELSGDGRVAKRGEELIRFRIPSFRKIARPLNQWRDHRLHSLGAGVTDVLWEPTVGTPLALKKGGSGWSLTDPIVAPLEERALPFLLTLLGGRVDGLSEDPIPEMPSDQLEGVLTLMKGEQAVRLEIHRVGVLSDERDFLMSRDPANFRFLTLELDDLISSRILQLNPDRIASIRVVSGSQQADFRRSGDGWAQTNQDLEEKSSAFLAALLQYGQTLERGEEVDLPSGDPAGQVIYAISRTPTTKGSVGLRWWVDGEGRNLVAALDGDRAYVSSVNFALGVDSMFAELPQANR